MSNCCEHHNLPAGCRQGRDCPRRHTSLHQQDGGHTFNGGVVFPIDPPDESDQALYTPESVAEPLPLFLWVLCALAAAVCFAIRIGALDSLFRGI